MAKKTNSKGVTLTEVIISTLIFALIIIGVIGTFVISVQISKKINYEYVATNLAKKRIERARTILKTDGLYALSDIDEENIRINENGEVDENGEYERTTRVAANYGNPRLVKVEADVYYYYNGKKANVPATMTTIFTDIE